MCADRVGGMTTLGISWLVFLAIMAMFSIFNIDFMVADWLYRLQGSTWSLKENLVTQAIIHRGGKDLSVTLGCFTFFSLLVSYFWSRSRDWRQPLLYLFLATLLSTLSISVIKQLVSMECPWDLIRYGGHADFVGLLEIRPATMPASACFPAGHASAGYAWITFYFFFSATRPNLRWLGLGLGIVMGLTFGIAQQLRGAHFLSHDLWTAMICWTVSFAFSQVMLNPARPEFFFKLGTQSS